MRFSVNLRPPVFSGGKKLRSRGLLLHVLGHMFTDFFYLEKDDDYWRIIPTIPIMFVGNAPLTIPVFRLFIKNLVKIIYLFHSSPPFFIGAKEPYILFFLNFTVNIIPFSTPQSDSVEPLFWPGKSRRQARWPSRQKMPLRPPTRKSSAANLVLVFWQSGQPPKNSPRLK